MQQKDEIVDTYHMTEQKIEIKEEKIYNGYSETDSAGEHEVKIKDNQVCMFVQTGIVRDDDDAKESLIMNYTDCQTEEKQYQRIQCDEIFFEKGNLKTHKKTFLEEANPSKLIMMHNEERPYQCSHCDNSFLEDKAFQEHMLIHKDKNKLNIKMKSDKTSLEKGYLTKNMNTLLKKYCKEMNTMIHTGKIPYQCTHCKKGFIDERHFKEHMWIHIERRKINTDRTLVGSLTKRLKKCKHCSAFLTNPLNYKIIHTEDRPYQCKHANCKNIFLHYSDIISHLRLQNFKAISVNTSGPVQPPSKPILSKSCITYKRPSLPSFDSFEKIIQLSQGQLSQRKNTSSTLNLSQEQSTKLTLQQSQNHLSQEQNTQSTSLLPLRQVSPQTSNSQSSLKQPQGQLFLKEATYQLPQGQLILAPQGTTSPLKLQLHVGQMSIQQPHAKSTLQLSQGQMLQQPHVKSALHLPHGQLQLQPHAQSTSQLVDGYALSSYKTPIERQAIVQNIPITSQTILNKIDNNQISKKEEIQVEKKGFTLSQGQLLFGSTSTPISQLPLTYSFQMSRPSIVQTTKIPEWLKTTSVTLKSCLKGSVPVGYLKRPIIACSNSSSNINTKQNTSRKFDNIEVYQRQELNSVDSHISKSKCCNCFTNQTNEPTLHTNINSDQYRTDDGKVSNLAFKPSIGNIISSIPIIEKNKKERLEQEAKKMYPISSIEKLIKEDIKQGTRMMQSYITYYNNKLEKNIKLTDQELYLHTIRNNSTVKTKRFIEGNKFSSYHHVSKKQAILLQTKDNTARGENSKTDTASEQEDDYQ